MQSAHKNSVKIQSFGLELEDVLLDSLPLINYFLELRDTNGLDDGKIREEIQRLLNMGIIVQKSMDVSKKTEYVDEKFKNLNSEFSTIIKDNFPKYLQEKLDEMIGQDGNFTKEIQNLLGNKTQYDQQINELIQTWNEKLEIMTNMNDTGSPFYHMLDRMRGQEEKIDQYLNTTKERTKAHMKGQTKGTDFEKSLATVFPEISNDLGCLYENTSSVQGKKNKKGDFLFTNKNTGKKFLVEAKRLGKDPKTKDVIDELAACLENRECNYGIYLYYDDDPETIPDAGAFNEVEPDKLFVCLNGDDLPSTNQKIIKIACKYAFIKTEEHDNQEGLETAKRLQGVMNRITQRKSKVDKIKKKTVEISKLSEQIIDEMEEDVRD